ncbi:hypothetical protein [Hydrogenivirga sp.]
MRYFLKPKLSAGLLGVGALLLLIGCSSYVNELPPEEVLKLYFSLLTSGDLKAAAQLKYNPATEWGYMKEALGAAVVLAMMSVVIRLTGLNPFTTMINCWLIENFVSEENRKYVLYAVGVLLVIMTVVFYNFLTGFLHRLNVEVDRKAFEGSEIEVLETQVVGDRAFVEYVIYLEDGRELPKRAELWFRDGRWYIRKL